MNNLHIAPRIWTGNAAQRQTTMNYAPARVGVPTGSGLVATKPYFHRVEETNEGEEVGPYTCRRTTVDMPFANRIGDGSPLNPTLRPPPANYLRESERKSERPYASSTQLAAPAPRARPYTPYHSQPSIENMISPVARQPAERPARPSQRIKLDGTVVTESSPKVSNPFESQQAYPKSISARNNEASQPWGAAPLHSPSNNTIRYERKSEQIGVYPTPTQAQWLQNRVSNTYANPTPSQNIPNSSIYTQNSTIAGGNQQSTYPAYNRVERRSQNMPAEPANNYSSYSQQNSWEQRNGYVIENIHQSAQGLSNPFHHSSSSTNEYQPNTYSNPSLYTTSSSEQQSYAPPFTSYAATTAGSSERAGGNISAQPATETLRVERKSQNIDDNRQPYFNTHSTRLESKQPAPIVEGRYPLAQSTINPPTGKPESRPAEQPQRIERKSNYNDFDSDDDMEHPPSVPATLKAQNPPPKQPKAHARPGRNILKDSGSKGGARKNVVFDTKEVVTIFDPYIVPKTKTFISQAPRSGAASGAQPLSSSRSTAASSGDSGRNNRTISRSVDPMPNPHRRSITQHNNPRSVNPAPPGRVARGSERPTGTSPVTLSNYY